MICIRSFAILVGEFGFACFGEARLHAVNEVLMAGPGDKRRYDDLDRATGRHDIEDTQHQ